MNELTVQEMLQKLSEFNSKNTEYNGLVSVQLFTDCSGYIRGGLNDVQIIAFNSKKEFLEILEELNKISLEDLIEDSLERLGFKIE